MMNRQTVLVAGSAAGLTSQLREQLEKRFGGNRYLVLFAKDKDSAKEISQQHDVNVFIFDGKIEPAIVL